jgi:hypothetical protein
VYPEWGWSPYIVPEKFWEKPANQRQFLDWAAAQLGLKEFPKDWYSVQKGDLIRLGAELLLAKYDNCMITALKNLYPELDWETWLFDRVPSGWWEEEV